jgi:Fe-S cluster biogenesis protein NfuA
MSLTEKVSAALEEVRPALEAHGGNVELVEVSDEGIVKVRLQGACKGCPMSQMTLTLGIERHLKEQVPGVQAVENVA